jgi:hypothetical protein
VRRGDSRRGLDLELALDVLGDAVFYRLLITGGPIDEPLASACSTPSATSPGYARRSSGLLPVLSGASDRFQIRALPHEGHQTFSRQP